MTREELVALVAARVEGSPPAMERRYIGTFDTDGFCPPCASKVAVARGFAADDIEPDSEDFTDSAPMWCENCGVLISSALTPAGAKEILVHWEQGRAHRLADRPQGAPAVSPSEWRVFLLCLTHLAEEHLPRAEKLLLASPPTTS